MLYGQKGRERLVFLANDSQPDYTDMAELPPKQEVAVWDYKAIYRIGDRQVGEFSESISITITRKVAV